MPKYNIPKEFKGEQLTGAYKALTHILSAFENNISDNGSQGKTKPFPPELNIPQNLPLPEINKSNEEPNQQTSKSQQVEKTKEEIIKAAEKQRDSSEDVIDDNGDLIDSSKNNSKTQEDSPITDINDKESPKMRRIERAKHFFDSTEEDGQNNQKNLIQDIRKKHIEDKKKQLARAAWQQANKNAARNYNYKLVNISVITNKIVNTIKGEVKKYRTSDYQHYNARSEEAGYVVPGRYWEEKYDIPKIGFFFDYSGSWKGNVEKIEMGKRIRESLIALEKRKLIKLGIFYFADKTSTNSDAVGSGNSDAPIPYIKQMVDAHELDNVIIMTDSDPSGNGYSVTVPGYCWLLFYDNVSSFITTSIKGKKGTDIYMIEHK